jgi:phosphoglycerate dehydrogenase-like enzyme
MERIVVVETAETARDDLGVEQSILGPDIELVRFECSGDEQRLASACQDANIILADLAPLTRTVVERASQCRLISVTGIGYDNVDVSAASDASISVCALDEYCTDEVADHTMLLILALIRRLPDYHDQVQAEQRWQSDSISGLKRLRGMTLGIIGLGKIGRAVARRASGFGMKLIANDHRPAEHATKDLDIQFCDLPTLLSESDVISLNCNLSAENRNLIDATAFAQMTRRPVLINCARGGLIDEAALNEALDAGQISGAGLDVLADEPPDFADLKLANRDNVILTPHVAYYSDSSWLESRKKSASNIRNFLDGRHELVRKYVFQANH